MCKVIRDTRPRGLPNLTAGSIEQRHAANVE
jgi:hypothetical protein